MEVRDLPDMYALSPWALDMHIRQIPGNHVTSNVYHFWYSKTAQTYSSLLCLFN